MNLAILPSINASLNSASAILLIMGYVFIRQKRVAWHKICMLGAVVTSSLFLIFYLYYHAHHGITRFQRTGAIRPIYFIILVSHTILAIVQVPLIVATLIRALRGQIEKHRAIAVITLPIWLYVSLTGVAVYWLLYKS